MSASTTFAADVVDLTVVQDRARDLADRCATRLRAEGLMARTVSVTVRTSDLRRLTRSRALLTPTDVGRELYLVFRELIAGVDLGGLPVRRVGVRVEGLTAVDGTVRRPMLDEAVGEPSRVREWSNASPERLARVSVDL